MSYDHCTVGFEAFENFVAGLRQSGTEVMVTETNKSHPRGPDLYATENQALRVAEFRAPNGNKMIAEEYLAIEDRNCDGRSLVAIAIYPDGQRPKLKTLIYSPDGEVISGEEKLES